MPTTETPNPLHAQLDQYSTEDLVAALVDDQRQAVSAVRTATVDLARAVDQAAQRLARGGRLVYVGAGTSGRLGVLDSVELLPTFSWPSERAIALIAGGERAMYRAIEGAEDNADQGAKDIAGVGVGQHDVVILLAASGATPYVLGAIKAARAAGALTIGLANNPDAAVTRQAEIGITLATGSEVISGSTRLKAGTAQKIALNTLSSAIMVRLNKVYGNLMVDLQPTNAKLYRRAVHLAVLATGADEERARSVLETCNYRVKTAIVALAKDIGVDAADALLEAHAGSVRRALA
ncbi:MAG: N-acetylmuramic acid 6-phosphate etherase [Betaproteobacteria bacterium]|nr:N-acetylmuramic acid 6-phosphate etherase [Betaproteobacteria bacterium]